MAKVLTVREFMNSRTKNKKCSVKLADETGKVTLKTDGFPVNGAKETVIDFLGSKGAEAVKVTEKIEIAEGQFLNNNADTSGKDASELAKAVLTK